MKAIHKREAKPSLSRLVEAGERGKDPEIIIARNRSPAAERTQIDVASTSKRIGVAKDAFDVPDDIDTHNDDVARLFQGSRK